MAPLGLAVLGPIGDLIGVRPLFIIPGIAVLLGAGLFVLSPGIRNLEDGPPARPHR